MSGDSNIKKMAFNKTFENTATAMEYYYFKTVWQPKENEVLACQFENGSFNGLYNKNLYPKRNYGWSFTLRNLWYYEFYH